MTIQGKFGDEDALFFEIVLIDDNGLELEVDAMFDTGFSYWLAVDSEDIDALNWVRVERDILRAAHGNYDYDV